MDLRNYKLKETEVLIEDVGRFQLREIPAGELVSIQSGHKPDDERELSDRQAAALYCKLICACSIDDKGERYLATEVEGENGQPDVTYHLDEVALLPWNIVHKLGVAAAKLNGMIEEKKTA